jgi:phosphoglycerate dehydrogenase-like enzyme
MKIIATHPLTDKHRECINAVAEGVTLVCPADRAELLAEIEGAEVFLGGIDRELFLKVPQLRWIQTWSAGVDGLLFPELVESDVILTSAKGHVGVHLAEHAMALLLALTRGVATALRQPGWHNTRSIREAAWELAGKTMGIVGLGGTGKALAQQASGFGMRILAVDPEEVQPPACVEAVWRMDRFYDLLGQSDVVAICAPLTPETEGLFDRAAFAAMPSHALLINVTRGRIMDEAALVEALETGQIGGAGLDVTPQEPLPEDHPLWRMPHVVITPHVAGGSPARDDRCIHLFCENLRRFLAGEELLSVIDKRKGY